MNKKPNAKGTIVEALKNAQYLVDVDGKRVRCYMSGKMHFNHISVVTGDWVDVVVEGDVGRIVRRL